MGPAGYGLLLLCGPLTAVGAVLLAQRIAVPYPILLVVVGALLKLSP